MKCFAGCHIDAVCGALGVELSDLFPPRGDDRERKPKVRKPWTAREVALALEVPLTSAFLILSRVAGGGVLSAGERREAGRCAEVCAAMIHELREG